jgi:hypothetical protein
MGEAMLTIRHGDCRDILRESGMVADRWQRNAILIELNPEYAAMADRRFRDDAGMFAEVASC